MVNGTDGGPGARLRLSTVEGSGADRVPDYDPRGVRVGIVHLGLGNFHRAHQASYTDDALAADPRWGICAVAPRNPAVAESLRAQDGLFSVWTRGTSESLRVVGSIRETRCAAEDPDGVLARIADPDVHLVTLTVTEKAYRADLSARRLRVDDDVRADAAGGAPRTVLGLLAKGLARRAAEDAPLTVLSCDNLTGNGALLRNLLRDYCTLLPSAAGTRLAEWIDTRVTFPSSMVDRIVPATTDDQRAEVARRLGRTDEAAVLAESFGQWVIEDDFAADHPKWPSPDVRLVDDVEPFERLKLRVVNATHSTLAYLGLLAGHQDVAGAAADPVLVNVLEQLLDEEIRPTLTGVPADALATYRDTVLARFANPAIVHPLRQVGADGSQKLPQRLLPVAVERHQAGERSPWVALAIAAWMLWVYRCATGAASGLRDPLADELAARAASASSPAELARKLLAVPEIFPVEDGWIDWFQDDVRTWLTALWSADPATAVRAVTRG